MFVDDDELVDLDGEGARARLATAVVRELMAGASPFSAVSGRMSSWSISSTEPPPVLPLLAITVLAATDMEASDGLSQTNYYMRLANCLTADGAEGLKARLEANFSAVDTMWEALSSWVESELGRVSTIRKHPRLVHIGYPLSQAMIRRGDRNALTSFWMKIDYTPGEEPPSGKELLRDLRRWITPTRGLTSKFVSTLQSLPPELEGLMGECLRQSARAWDGEPRDRYGNRIDRAALSMVMGNGTAVCEWLIGDLDDAETLSSTRLQADHLRNGLHDARGNMQHAATPYVLLRYDSGLQRWLEVQDFRPVQEHALVYLSEVWATSAQRFAAASDAPNLALPRQVEGAREVRVVLELRFASRERLEAALREASMRGLVFESQRRPRMTLADGLRVTNELTRRVYIVGGAPDLLLPEGNADDRVPVSLDGSPETPLVRSGLAIPLRLFDLVEGHHKLSGDETVIDFELVADGEDVTARAEPSLIGLPLNDVANDDGLLECPEPYVRGGLPVLGDALKQRIDVWGSRLVIAQRGMDSSFLLGPGGHVRAIHESSTTSAWREMAGDLKSWTFLVERARLEGWLLQRRGDRIMVTQLAAVPYGAALSDGAHVNWMLWRDLLKQGSDACRTAAWRELIDSAGLV